MTTQKDYIYRETLHSLKHVLMVPHNKPSNRLLATPCFLSLNLILKNFTKYFVGRGVLKVIEIIRDGDKNEHKKVTKLDFRVKQPQSNIRVIPQYGSSGCYADLIELWK